MRVRLACLAVPALLVVGCSEPAPTPAATPSATTTPTGPVTPPTTDAGMITSAMAAAPDAISKSATIVTMDDKMQMKTLRQGTNGWTCMPDLPTSPGADPMCVDANGLIWLTALMEHKDPPKDKMAFAYMLMGGSDATNTDPFATAPPAGKPWIDTGPHVMVMNIGAKFTGYPTTPDNPKAPYVMWPNTPYAHLMIPVK